MMMMEMIKAAIDAMVAQISNAEGESFRMGVIP
jgi:hypothetical protein